MKDFHAKADPLLKQVLGNLPDPIEFGPDRINTSRELIELAGVFPNQLNENQINTLNVLCRKVHVSKTVMECYLPGWNLCREAAVLPMPYWPLLVMILLSRGGRVINNEAEGAGLPWKYLNTALTILDFSQVKKSMPLHHELSQHAEEILETAFAGAVA